MEERMKKGLLLLFLAVFICFTVTAGGGSQSSSVSTAKPVLSGFGYVSARLMVSVTNFNENYAFQELERATGVHVDWFHPPVGQHTEQASLIIASGDLPDIFYIPYNDVGGLAKMLSDGTIIKLNQYLDTGKMPHYKSWVDKYPTLRRQLLMDDGTCAAFLMLRIREYMGQIGWFPNGGLVLRRDWLDALNLQAPTTVAEYENVLRAFKTRNPNGSGRNDVIPLVTDATNWSNFAQFFGMNDGFYELNGAVRYGPIEPRYRDYMTTMARWQRDGLIDPDWTTANATSMQAKYLENRAGSHYTVVAAAGNIIEIMRDTIPNADFIGVRHLKNESDGKVYNNTADLRQSFVHEGSVISTQCKNVDAALRYLDYSYSPEGYTFFNWGELGVSYEVRNGEKFYTDEIWKNPKGYSMEKALHMYAMSMCQWSMPKDPVYWVQASLRFPFQEEALNNWGNVDHAIAMLPVSFTTEESRRYNQLIADINTLRAETATKIILGTEPVSALDAMVTRMKSMGIDEAIKIQQDALNRYNARR